IRGRNSWDRRSFAILAASAVPAYKLSALAKLLPTRDQAEASYVCPPCGLNCDKLTFDKPGTCPACGMTLIEKVRTEGERLTVESLMQSYKVPGLSVAIIDNFKIADTRVYGVTEAGGTTTVTSHTLFQAGSVSKAVAAVGALRLVQDDKLWLDEDLNRRLKSWKVPENEFTKE